MRIAVVGVGALGSHVVQFVRNLDADIVVVDFDRVEQKNTLSQFHSKPAVGKNKANALKQSMKFLWGRTIDANPHRLTADNEHQILGDADLIIDCLDNAQSRRIVSDYARLHDIPCLHGALDGAGTFGRVAWDYDFPIDEEPADGAATCEDGAHLPFIGTVAAFVARAAQLFVEENKRRGYANHPGGSNIA